MPDEKLALETSWLEELIDGSGCDVRNLDATVPGTITYEQHEPDTKELGYLPPRRVTVTVKVEEIS